MVGGGVRGKDAGIAHGTMTQVGSIIKALRRSIDRYPQVGGMTTGVIGGEGIRGITNEYLTNKFNGTGASGKREGIGKSKTLGVSKG